MSDSNQVTGNSVSVIVPTRNRQRLLARSLKVLRGQRLPELEIIVVDDGSSDGTASMVQGLGDPRVRLIQNPRPLGVAGARNRGLEAASGTWVAFSDDDDLWSSNKLGRQLSALRSCPEVKWCAVGAATADEQFRVQWVQRPPQEADTTSLLLAGNVIPGGGSGVMASADLVREAGGFDDNLSMFADWDLWIRLALRSDMVSVSDLLVLVVHHTGNMSLNVSLAGAELDRMTDKYKSDRASRGIPSDGVRTLRWMAYADARAGRRLQAARRGLSLARHQRSFTPLRSAFLALLGPTAIQIRQDHRSCHIPPHSLAEAEALVEEIKDLSLPPGLRAPPPNMNLTAGRSSPGPPPLTRDNRQNRL